MLPVGAHISFQSPEDDATVSGVVKSCNKRGTSCVVQTAPHEQVTINLNKIKHQLREDDTGPSILVTQQAEEDGDGSALEEGSDPQDSDHPEKEDSDAELQDVGEQRAAEDEAEVEEVQLPELDAFNSDTAQSVEHLCTALESLQESETAPEALSSLAKAAIKALHDFTSASSISMAEKAEAPELYVDGFDAEQIWCQLDAESGPALKKMRRQFHSIGPEPTLIDTETEAALDDLLRRLRGEEANASDSDASEQMSDLGDASDKDPLSDFEGSLEGDAERQPAKKLKRTVLKQNGAADDNHERLETEDDFLRLDDMERFVQDAELAASKQDDEDAQNDDETEDESDDGGDAEGLDLNAIPDNSSGEDDAPAAGSGSDAEDAELGRLLDSAQAMAGRPRTKGSKQMATKLRIEEEEQEEIYYDDFFGTGPRSSKQHKDRAEPEQIDLLSQEKPLEGNEEDNALGEIDVSGEELEDFELDNEDNLEDDIEAGVAQDDDDSDGQERLLSGLRQMIADKKAEEQQAVTNMSAHEKRVAKMAGRVQKLEEEHMGEKEWYLRGETRADTRPLNSALEIDMDFDRTLKPPPQPTEEFTTSLEDLIKQRIVDAQFDDPRRLAPPADDFQKELAELDDKQSSKGLGEIYADEFVRAKTGNAVEDKDEATRLEAKILLKALFGKLDSLSHFHFAPKPIIKELTVQTEVPALAVEEVAPQVVSEAARQLPEEVYSVQKSNKKDEALDKAERKRSRASMKRAVKKKKDNEADEKHRTGVLADGSTNVIGRKSAVQDNEALAAEKRAKKRAKRARSKQEDGPKIKYTKSSAVFGKIQDMKDGKLNLAHTSQTKPVSSKGLKL